MRTICTLGASMLLMFTYVGSSHADTFGSGANQFTIDFASIGNPGNPADNNFHGTAGTVDYIYRMGKFEVSRDMVSKANAEGDLGLTLWDMSFVTGGTRPNMPASGLTWNQAARFINWLNESKGFSPAYKFNSQPGDAGYDPDANISLWEPSDPGYDASNLFRNSLAHYFLPSRDEWYKAAYYDPSANGGTGGYWDYPIGSDRPPLAIVSGTDPETAVYANSQIVGPADITQAGGLSPYGLMGMGGNIAEWHETEIDLLNDDGSANRMYRGGHWSPSSTIILSVDSQFNEEPSVFVRTVGFDVGFRVASIENIPEPSSLLLILGFASGLVARRRLLTS